MYKMLLSWRYLRTRYIALASIISVTLGVATLIVVNSVMAGFTREMNDRLHGILSDIVFESGLDGFPDAEWHMEQIRHEIGDDIEGMTAVVHVPALIRMMVRGEYHTRQINLIGVDKATYAKVSHFGEYLQHPENRKQLSFLLRENGYAPEKKDFPPSGWEHRRLRSAFEEAFDQSSTPPPPVVQAAHTEPAAPASDAPPEDPYSKTGGDAEAVVFNPAKEQHPGIIIGIALCSVRARDDEGEVQDFYLCRPGDDVEVIFPTSGASMKAANSFFTVVDFYESQMSEYDSSFAFVPLERLQDLRGMIDPSTGVSKVSSIQIKLKPGADLNAARDKLRARFPQNLYPYRIDTWRDMQGPLLAAVRLETTILNILLFLIIAVAGFGILATFFMIVVEKTRDIGILKALGAPSTGVMSIFLSYGVSLGVVGSGVGMVLGLLFVWNINEIAGLLELVTGQEVFDPTVYYFQEIPVQINPFTIAWVTAGAVLIAVMASVLPAIRAARLHPVEALRYE